MSFPAAPRVAESILVEIDGRLRQAWGGVRVVLCIAAVALGTLFPGAARGEPDDAAELELGWLAPAGCPDLPAMRAWILSAAGGADAARGVARARAIAGPDGGWTAEVDVGDGARLLRGDSCEEVAGAAALVIGIALRSAREVRPARPGVQASDPEVPWSSSVDPSVAARLARPARARWSPAVTAQAGAMVGALPAPAPMARVGVALRGGAAVARMEAAVATSWRGLRLESQDEALVRVDFFAAVASGCYAARWLWLCAGLEVGAMRGVASAADAEVSGAGTWVAGRAGPSTSLPLTPAVDLVLEADAAVPIAYPVFSVNGTALPDPDPVSVRTSVGVRIAIP